MKHIKTYNESILDEIDEAIKELVLYLEDIFMELVDDKFIVSVEKMSGKTTIIISISKYSPWVIPMSSFKYGLIKDYVDSAKDYINTFFQERDWSMSSKFIRYEYTNDTKYIRRAMDHFRASELISYKEPAEDEDIKLFCLIIQ